MEAPSILELEALRYPELRKLAKQAGIKANLKADRLLKTLKKHFHPSALPEQSSDDSDVNCSLSDKDELPICEEKVEPAKQQPTTRRGRGKKAVQKSLPVETSLKEEAKEEILTAKIEQSQVNNNETGEETSIPGSATRQRKRQRPEEDPENPSDARKPAKTSGRNSTITAPPAGKIPRYAGRLSKAAPKPSTPDFKKLHEAHFKKMESIDKYMERKQKRLEAVSSAIQEVKMLAKKSNLLRPTEETPNSGSNKLAKKSNLMANIVKTPGSSSKKLVKKTNIKTPGSSSKKSLQSRFYLFSPAPQKRHSSPLKTPANPKRPGRSSAANKSILVDKSAFKPTALSVSKMNVRFSEATKDNEHKRSLIKTPARKSSGFGTPASDVRKSFPLAKNHPESEPSRRLTQITNNSESDMDKSLPLSKNALNQSAVTPFKFTAQAAATPNTNKKKFDLQASLSRPLGYQPHKGKLKPWEPSKENQSSVTSHVSALKSNFKQPPLSSRSDRRRQHEEERKVKRDKTIGTRRGIAP